MSRSGGNTTGIGILAGQLDGKRLEILHELITAAGRIGLLVDPTQVGQAEVEAVGRNLDLELITRGLATSMSRSGGNTTGIGILAGQLDGK